LFPFDPRVVRYALPLALTGWALALFHWGVASGLIPESITPCSQGVPCSVEQIVWFGFLTLPMLSVLAFSVIIALLLITHFKASE
jgi:disulfide bond formation protein DsbB